jgi:hypothetical protein
LTVGLRRKTARFSLAIAAALALMTGPRGAQAGITARYVRVENPTGFVMEWQEIEVLSGGRNVVLKHPELFSGTVVEGHDPKLREGVGMTDGKKDTHLRGGGFLAATDPVTHIAGIDPWFEIDLGQAIEIDQIVLYGSRYPERLFMDKGHRLVSVLDATRHVVWAAKWNYYDKRRYPEGIFAFALAPVNNPAIGRLIAKNTGDWVAMGWLLDATELDSAPDSALRLQRFAARNDPANLERLARKLFSLLADDVPKLAGARQLFAAGKYAESLDAWKKFWFAKMQRVNLHAAIHDDFFTYATHGEDLLRGISVTIGNTSARANRFTPGAIHWIDVPDPTKDNSAFRNALTDCEQKAQVGRVTRPLLQAYGRQADPQYIGRWCEMMDDWSLNFFEDAARTPYEVEMLFTFAPCIQWQILMENLADLAAEHPQFIDQLSSATLARVQLICLEKYSTAWWRQARETVFNHETGGITAWGTVQPYIDEFYPGRRCRQEWQQQFERWMTLGTEPDGSMTEIGDEGHMAMPTQLGFPLARLELAPVKPDWYTPGWRNRALQWFDGGYKYIFRHLSPGGYEHRFAVGYRPDRWSSLTKPYSGNQPQNPPMLDRGGVIFAIPEIRRILDALGHISAGGVGPVDPLRRPLLNAQREAHDAILALLGNDRPGMPHINSDWMPYTGAYYFRSGWEDNAAFLAMMACGSHGGSQPTQWPYGMFYHYDYNYPLLRANPTLIDGLPPNQLFGRRTFEPGTKTIALTNAEEKPAPHRWHSSERFAFGEAIYHGAYQRLPAMKGDWDYHLEQLPAGKALENVRTARQILQLRASRLFIVTEAIRFNAAAEQRQTHQLSLPLKLSLSTREKGASKPFSPEQLQIDAAGHRLRTDNPDGPSVTLYQFAGFPLQYRRGSPAKVDAKSYSARLTSNVGIADQDVFADFQGAGELVLVNLVSSRQQGAEDRVASVEPLNRGPTVAGFHAKLLSGGEIWYQAAASGSAELLCGPIEATAQALLVATQAAPSEFTGILLGSKSLSMDGKPLPITDPDCEFTVSPAAPYRIATTPIYTPVDPVRFLPNINTFIDSQVVAMTSDTPNVEIRYTTDGTQPGPASQLYTGPVTIRQDTEFAARAYRLGPDGKPLAADEFEINGTRFSLPTYGWFYKKAYLPAANVSEYELQPGLNYDFLQAPWHRLYASAHWLPAAGGGTAQREMDLSKVATNAPYGMRYQGYLRIPADGLYTFHAPHELMYMDNAASYDLRLYIDGREWYLTQWWHGHGTWSVPLRQGFHTFQVDFADARSTPWRKSGIWRYYPRAWVIFQGPPSDILLSGPGLERVRIPAEWFFRKPIQRTYPDERVLVDSQSELHCAVDGVVSAPLSGVDAICFQTVGEAQEIFAGLVFVKVDGTQQPFSSLVRDCQVTSAGGLLTLRLHGSFDRLTGTLRPGERATIVFQNTMVAGSASSKTD